MAKEDIEGLLSKYLAPDEAATNPAAAPPPQAADIDALVAKHQEQAPTAATAPTAAAAPPASTPAPNIDAVLAKYQPPAVPPDTTESDRLRQFNAAGIGIMIAPASGSPPASSPPPAAPGLPSSDAWRLYQREPDQPKTSVPLAVALTAADEAAPMLAGVASMSGGAKLGTRIGLRGGPWGGAIGGVVGGLIGQATGSYLAAKGQDALMKLVFSPDQYNQIRQTQAQATAEHPIATTATRLGAQLIYFRPLKLQSYRDVIRMTRELVRDGKAALTAERNAQAIRDAVNVTFGAGTAASAAAIQKIMGGDVSPLEFAISVATGAFLARPTAVGRKLGLSDYVKLAAERSPGTPTEPPPLPPATVPADVMQKALSDLADAAGETAARGPVRPPDMPEAIIPERPAAPQEVMQGAIAKAEASTPQTIMEQALARQQEPQPATTGEHNAAGIRANERRVSPRGNADEASQGQGGANLERNAPGQPGNAQAAQAGAQPVAFATRPGDGVRTLDDKTTVGELRRNLHDAGLNGELKNLLNELEANRHSVNIGEANARIPKTDEAGAVIGYTGVSSPYEGGLTADTIPAIRNVLEGKTLTRNQADEFQKAATLLLTRADRDAGFNVSTQERIAQTDIPVGASVRVNGEKFTAIGETDTGNLVLKDGTERILPPDESLVIDKGSLTAKRKVSDTTDLSATPRTTPQAQPSEPTAAMTPEAFRASLPREQRGGAEENYHAALAIRRAMQKGEPINIRLFNKVATEQAYIDESQRLPLGGTTGLSADLPLGYAPSYYDRSTAVYYPVRGGPVNPLFEGAKEPPPQPASASGELLAAPESTRPPVAGETKRPQVEQEQLLGPLKGSIAAGQADRAQGKLPGLDAEAQRRAQAGAVLSPSAVSARLAQFGGWIRRNFTPTRGTGKEFYSLLREMKSAENAAALQGRIDKSRLEAAVKDIATTGRIAPDTVRATLSQMMDGTITPAAAQQALNVPAQHRGMIDSLSAIAQNRQRAQAIADNIERTGGSIELANEVRNNANYQTRFYKRWLLGDAFEPEPQRYAAVVDQIKTDLADDLQRLSGRASALTAQGFDAKTFLETGNVAMLANLPQQRMDAVMAMSSQYRRLRQVIDTLQRQGNTVTAMANADALADAAASYVNYHLGKETGRIGAAGGVNIANLIERKMNDPLWRELYGEVTDPAWRQAETAEVQERMLARQAFFNRLADDGQDRWWSAMRSEARGHTVRLGDPSAYMDRLRYGRLAGMWVSRDAAELIMPQGQKQQNAVIKYVWFMPQATMRMLKLQWPKSYVRNYGTAILDFAAPSGDMFLPSWLRRFREGHGIVQALIKGKTGGDPRAYAQALATLKELATVDAFRTDTTTINYALEQMLSGMKGGKLLKDIGSAYSFIDFPTKYAAYRARVDAGLTPAQAAEHVRSFYQYRDFVPPIVGKITRAGVSDYLGYTYDSARIRANQVSNAIRAAKAGDVRPALWLLTSLATHPVRLAAAHPVATGSIATAWFKAHRAIRRDEKNVAAAEVLQPKEQYALRAFLPDYYQNAELLTERETRKDGSRYLYYTALPGNTAFPLEDDLMGAMQYSWEQGAPDLGTMLKQAATSRIEPGMWPEALYRFWTGEGPFSPYKAKGISDVLGVEDPEKLRVVAGSFGQLFTDVYGGQAGTYAKRVYDVLHRKDAGQRETPIAGTYQQDYNLKEVAGSAFSLIRTYRVSKDDFSRILRNRVGDIANGIKVAKGRIAAAAKEQHRRGTALPEQLHAAQQMESARIEYLHRIEGLVANARTVTRDWYSHAELKAILQDAGLDNREANAVMQGKVADLPAYRYEYRKTHLEKLAGGQKEKPSGVAVQPVNNVTGEQDQE